MMPSGLSSDQMVSMQSTQVLNLQNQMSSKIDGGQRHQAFFIDPNDSNQVIDYTKYQ